MSCKKLETGKEYHISLNNQWMSNVWYYMILLITIPTDAYREYLCYVYQVFGDNVYEKHLIIAILSTSVSYLVLFHKLYNRRKILSQMLS